LQKKLKEALGDNQAYFMHGKGPKKPKKAKKEKPAPTMFSAIAQRLRGKPESTSNGSNSQTNDSQNNSNTSHTIVAEIHDQPTVSVANSDLASKVNENIFATAQTTTVTTTTTNAIHTLSTENVTENVSRSETPVVQRQILPLENVHEQDLNQAKAIASKKSLRATQPLIYSPNLSHGTSSSYEVLSKDSTYIPGTSSSNDSSSSESQAEESESTLSTATQFSVPTTSKYVYMYSEAETANNTDKDPNWLKQNTQFVNPISYKKKPCKKSPRHVKDPPPPRSKEIFFFIEKVELTVAGHPIGSLNSDATVYDSTMEFLKIFKLYRL
jgi:hypothetical protein